MSSSAFWHSFSVALIGTLKVFAMGMAGFFFLRRGWLDARGLQTLGRLIAWLTMPCLIFYRFALGFNPATFPDWWKFVLSGLFITAVGLLLGRVVALRHGGNDEATLLVGFQNAGFFVLPMLQALLPEKEFARGALMLFMLIIPFNASLWLVGSWLLLHRKAFDWRTLLTPPFCATLVSLVLYGLLHDWMHGFNDTLPMQVLLGGSMAGSNVGAVQMIGDLTVPLATLLLGASIADAVRGRFSDLEGKRAALEVTGVKMLLYPVLGYGLLQLGAHLSQATFWHDSTVRILLILQFASPPAVALSVFAQEHGYRAKFIPLACLICYIVCLLTVPVFVALVQ
jgi:predicted permease